MNAYWEDIYIMSDVITVVEDVSVDENQKKCAEISKYAVVRNEN